MRTVQVIIKWICDRIAAMVLIVLFAPLMALFAIWIMIDDGRPMLFVQQRAGKRGKPFAMLKFRSMVKDAISIGRQQQISADPFGIVHNDPRITRSGKFLRRTGLDELPQLFNVLIGNMSLIGPRPDLVEQAANYSESDKRRLSVLPGITGYSQVHGRDEIEWPERIQQDIWYIENFSLKADIVILWQTFFQLFRDEPNPVEDTMNIERSRSQHDA